MKVISKPEHGPFNIFISYSHQDERLARTIGDLLRYRLNTRVFLDSEISAGRDWQSELRKQLKNADVVIPVLSPSSMNSSWVLSELGAAWSLEKPILPVVTNRAVLNNIPIRVDPANIVEWIDEPGQADRFIDHVQQVLAHIHA